jgi:uridine kinase
MPCSFDTLTREEKLRFWKDVGGQTGRALELSVDTVSPVARTQVREYLDCNELGLAWETLCDAVLEPGAMPPEEVRDLLLRAGTRMGLGRADSPFHSLWTVLEERQGSVSESATPSSLVLRGACAAILSEIQRLRQSRPSPVVVALDGGSGSGKSTLAALIAKESAIAVIPVDDFFAADIPECNWETFSVEERLARVFDWQRLREQALKPLLDGQPARWTAFDFVAGQRPDGTYGMQSEPIILEPADVILLDGTYSAGPELGDLVDLAVLIDVPVKERHARTASREDADFLEHWHQLWDPVEAFYFTCVRPKASFDLVVSGD